MKRFFAVFCIISLVTGFVPARAALADFDPNLVISDIDLRDTGVPDDFAQKFLESHGSGLASMKFMDLDGTLKTPGSLITYYGKSFGVNPKFLLALIQKEQSLVTDPAPSDCQLKWATGYNRPDGSSCTDDRKYSGFTNQIVGAAAFAQCFYEDVSSNCGSQRRFGYQLGRVGIVDSHPVIPNNLATAMLYSYTPHLHGNQLLSSIWSTWFTSTYPDGSYIKASNGTVYVIQGGLKRPFASRSALASRVKASRIVPVSDSVLMTYQDGAAIKFADYSLVRVPTGGIFLLAGDVKRPIVSMKVFRTIGFNLAEVDDVDPADLASYSDGDPITLKSVYPTGVLLRDKKSGAVFWVESGKKYPVISLEIMKTNYPGKKLTTVSSLALGNYPSGDPVKFKDGELVTSPEAGGMIYVISNGQRRAVASDDVFKALGYTKDRVIHTSDAALELQPPGAPVTFAANDATLALDPLRN